MLKPIASTIMIGLALTHCGKEVERVSSPFRQVSHYRNLTNAPDFIQLASESVVRITFKSEFSGHHGTGFAVSDDGLLATNTHVLGPDSCFQEGCFAELTFNYQTNGRPYRTTAFLKPVAIEPQADFTILQAYDTTIVEKDQPQQKTENKKTFAKHLKFASNREFPKLGQTVHSIGHPRGMIKKWTKGIVTAYRGQHLLISNQSMGGQSGSPILNQEGEVIGILYGGNVCEKDSCITPSGDRETTIAASIELIQMTLEKAGLVEKPNGLFLSTSASHPLIEKSLARLNNLDLTNYSSNQGKLSSRQESRVEFGVAYHHRTLFDDQSEASQTQRRLERTRINEEYFSTNLKDCENYLDASTGITNNDFSSQYNSPISGYNLFSHCMAAFSAYKDISESNQNTHKEKMFDIANRLTEKVAKDLGSDMGLRSLVKTQSILQGKVACGQIITYIETHGHPQERSFFEAGYEIACGNSSMQKSALNFLDQASRVHSSQFDGLELMDAYFKALAEGLISKDRLIQVATWLIHSDRTTAVEKLAIEDFFIVDPS